MATLVLLATTLIIPFTEVAVWGQEMCSPWIYNVETKKCYKKFCDARSANSAEEVCKKNSGHLVTVCSGDENTFVGYLANIQNDYHSTRDDTWIGLYRDPNNKKIFLWKSGETCGYRKWEQNEPNDAGGNEDSVHYYSHANLLTWNDDPGSRDNHYICERKLCPLDEQ